MKKIKILVYGMTDKVGGMETFFINYYRTFDHNRLYFCFLTNYPTIAFREEIESHGDKIVSITKRSDNPIKNHFEMKKFFKGIKDKFDVCYMMALDVANVDFLKYCKRAGINVRIIHSHNSDMKRPSAFKQFISIHLHERNKKHIGSLATEFWACSKKAASWIFPDDLNEKVKIIHNAIPVEDYQYNSEIREKIRKEYNISKDTHIYAHVGRFMQQKNPIMLINIFEKIIEKDDRAQCWMIGDGPMRNQIENRIEELGLKDKIVLLGQKNNVAELMQAMDVFVFPSLFEGLSLVMIEAQAAGLPILASNTLSSEHTITNTIRYYSFEKTAEEWATGAARMLCEIPRENKINELRRAGYDIAIESRKIIDMHNELLKENLG